MKQPWQVMLSPKIFNAMKRIKSPLANFWIASMTVLIIPNSLFAQSANNRIELQRHDLSVAGREVVQVIVKIAKGDTVARHKHPGEEIIYVLEGLLEYQIEGQPKITLKAGEVLFVPAATIHMAKNVGNGNAAELATYIVEKGKPLIEFVK
jgi:quercetin dioxygenase-like cupin family protein